MRQKLTTLDFKTKRMSIEMLDIKVWLEEQNVEIAGTIPTSDGVIVATQS